MKKLLAITIITLSLNAAAQKTVDVAPTAIFPFDPVSTRYNPKNLAPVATYVEAWRNEGQTITLAISPDSLSWGWKYYTTKIDTTLLPRIAKYLSASITKNPPDSTISPKIYDFPNSREFLTHFQTEIQSIRQFFATPIAIIPAVAVYSPYNPSAFSSIFHAFQLSTGADISLLSPPSITSELPCSIYIATIARLLPFDNQIVTARITGAEIIAMLEVSISKAYYTINSERSDLVTPRSRPMSIAPTSYTIDVTRPRGRRIVECNIKRDSTYTIALNSFAARKIPAVNPIGDYKIALVEFLRNNTPTQNPENWKIIPQRWTDKIKSRESLQIKLL